MTIKDERDQEPASMTSGAQTGVKIECDSRMRIISVSPSFAALTGRQAEDCEGMKMLGLVRPKDHEVFTFFFDQALLRGDSWSEAPFAIMAKGGDMVWLEGRAQTLRDEDNNSRIILSLNDVTARKNLQDELIQTKSVLLAITEQTKTGYILMGKDLTIITFNESAEARFLMQFRKPPLAGVSMLEYMQEERKADMRELYLDTLAGKSSSFHISFPGPDGKVRWYLGHVFPVYTEDKQIVGIIHSSEDITERKMAEWQKEQAIIEQKRQNRHLEQVTHIISHNLLSPISRISELARILRNGESLSKADLERCLEGLQASAARIDETVVDLNLLLQQRHDVNGNKGLVHFPDLMQDVLSWLPGSGQETGVEITTDFQVKEYLCNQVYMQSIFHNLISNSFKYRSPSRTLRLSVSTRVIGGRLELKFGDNGQGIDMARHSAKLFGLYEKFHHNADGKGMGLYMVKTQTELMGGTISVVSAIDQGCESTLTFPLAQADQHLAASG